MKGVRRATTPRERERRGLGRPARAACLAAGLALGALLGPAAALSAAARWLPAALELRELRVQGLTRVAAAELLAASELAPGARLDGIDTDALAERLAAHPWIAEVRVAKLPPGRLLLAVREREPVAVALLEHGASDAPTAWWVDAAGVAFAPVEGEADAQLPRLLGAGAAPGQPDALLAAGVGIAARLEARGLPAARAVLLGDAPPERLPALELSTSGARVLLGAGDLDARLEGLAALLAAKLPEVESASEIDLRFGGRAVLRSDPARDGGREADARGGAPPPG